MNDIVPQGDREDPRQNGVATVIEKLIEGGVPQIIAGPAGKALSTLVGAAVLIPANWLKQKAQAIQDETDARSQVVKALAANASAAIAADPELATRAAHRWLGSAIAAQDNVEAIAGRTTELLQDASNVVPDGQDIDDDWMSGFISFAEKANTDSLRDLLSRILAGKIRNNSSFNLAAIQFIATADREILKIAEKQLSRAFVNQIFKIDTMLRGPDMIELKELVSKGLLIDDLTNSISIKPPGANLSWPNKMMVMLSSEEKSVTVNTAYVTATGQQIASLLAGEVDDDYVTSFRSHLEAQFGPGVRVVLHDTRPGAPSTV